MEPVMEWEPLGTLAASFVPWMIEIHVRSLLVLFVAWITWFALRRSSAAIRHLALSFSVAGLLALPLLLLLPSGALLPWSLPLFYSARSPETLSVSKPVPAADGQRSTSIADASPPAHPKRESETFQPSGSNRSRGSFRASLGAGFLAISVWALGASFLLLRLGRDLLRLHRIVAESEPIADAAPRQCARVSAILAAQGSRHRAVRLLIAPTQMVGPSPMTWGILRPIVLLPAEFASWPENRLRSVLLHELAHVQRRDWGTELLGRVASALYWPNPLVWMLVRFLRHDSERACDDTVLLAGVAPVEYAQHLIEVVRTLKAQRRPSVAIMMAQRPSVESRVRAIISENHSRRPATVRAVATALILTTGVLLLLAKPRTSEAGGQASGARRTRIAVPEKYRKAGLLRLATDATYPPFEFVKYSGLSKGLRGFDIDLGDALGKELGLKMDWVDTSWDSILSSLTSGKADLIISGMTITEERKRDRAFTHPYFLSGQTIARRRGDISIVSLTDLRQAGRVVAVQRGTTGETVALNAKVPAERVKRYESLPTALMDLRIGRADAVVADFPALRDLIAIDSPELEIASRDFLVRESLGIAARKDDGRLVEALNQALDRLLENGTYAKIYKRWMGEAPGPALLADLKRARNAGEKVR